MKGVILDADSLGACDLAPLLETLPNFAVHGWSPPHVVAERIADANVVLTNKVVLDRSVIESAAHLKLISVMATGTNNIDGDAAREKAVPVCNAVGYATPSVVQHTLNLMLALSTNMQRYAEDVREGKWQQSKVFCLLDHPIVELSGKKLGIVGYGTLGSGVAHVAQAFGMDVLISARPGTRPVQDRIAFLDLIPQVDYLSLHCPLTEDTQNLIDERVLAEMKPGAFLINTARGGLIDPVALLSALEHGAIGGAAIDVLPEEPPRGNDLLSRARHPNLIVTPHNAWGAIESRTRLIQQMRENVLAFLSGKVLRVVN